MYDDMSSLSEKLQISGFSFQEVMKEKKSGAKLQAVLAAPAAETVKPEPASVATQPIAPAEQHDVTYLTSAAANIDYPQISASENTASAAKPFAAPLTRNTIFGSVADMLEKSSQIETEKQPVRLDMLFSMIAQKRS